MPYALPSPHIPRHIQVLFVVFFAANLTHFAHNAEYISFYPGIPAWLTREKVYWPGWPGPALGFLACFSQEPDSSSWAWR